ncbi:unnamed protein product [Schistosoma curassoni]|nr:unnamed protein product [Schistosoma curassoni]
MLQFHYPSMFCRDRYIVIISYLCLHFHRCARNRCKTNWYHFSLGEHVCSSCYEFLDTNTPKYRSQSVNYVWRHRMNSWRREWLKKSSQLGRRRILNAANFLAAQMLPWWLKCNKCGLWRQLPPQTTVGSSKCNYRPDKFTCADVVKFSNNPCSWPVDERAKIVISRPHDFLASMQTHAWLQASPALKVSSSYGVDLAGLSPDPLPGSTDEDENSVSSDSPFSVFEEDGAFSPIDLHAWERFSFSEMSRFPTLYLAVRNLVLCLWFHNPKRLITSKFAANHCFVRGLLRIVLCEHWIPHLIEEFTCRGLINVGVCQIDTFDLAVESDQIVTGVSKEQQQQQQIPSKFQLRLIGDSDLTTAVTIRQLWNALYLHQLHVQSSQHVQSQQQKLYFPVSIKSVPSPSVVSVLSTFTNSLNNNKLAELMIQFSTLNNTIQSTVELFTNNGFDKNICNNNNNNGEMKNLTSNVIMLKRSKQYPVLSIPSLMSPVQIDENKNLSGIFVPLHSWSDRIYTYPHHPVSIFAWQTGLELHPIAKCLLLQPSSSGFVIDNNNNSDEDNNINKFTLIPSSQSVRIEFHVEAILDLVIQLYSDKTNAEINPKLEEMEGVDLVTDINKNDNNTVLKSITHRLLDRTSSVEDCWDEMDAEVRRRLTDLTGNSIEQSLIEYFLASVEYDLTEPLTTNFTELSKSSSSMRYLQPLTARLDQLPVCCFNAKTVTSTTVTAEFSQQQSNNLNSHNENLTAYVIRTPSSIMNCTNESNNCLIPGPINYLRNCLMKDINENITCDDNGLNQLISIILENNDFDVNTGSLSSSSDDNIIDVSSSMHIVSTPLKQFNSVDNNNNNYTKEKVISDDLKSIRLNYTNGTELVDWVIVTTPIDRIRLYFVPKSLVSNDMLNHSVQYSKQTYLSIYLPPYLRSFLIDEHYLLKNEPYTLDVNRSVDKNIGQYSTNARLITITLVYSSSWWRQYTTERFVNSDPSHTVSSHGDSFSELFSFLPDTRENRGFCHVFRDLRPDINSPGILQTQLFAASADHWWDKTDVLLQTAVDRYLKTHFMISSSTEESQFSDRFHLLSSYVARLQAPNMNYSSDCICVVNNEENDYKEQWFHVKRSAWMELVKRTGILIVNLIQNENYIDYDSRKENCLHINNYHANCLTTSEMIYTSNPLHYSGMDAMTSSVQAGLELANLTLHLLPHRNQFHSKFSSLVSTNETVISVDDQSNDTCDPNSNESFNNSHSHRSLDDAEVVKSSWGRVQNSNCQSPESYFNNNAECLSARTRRLLKRRHSESDQNLICLE